MKIINLVCNRPKKKNAQELNQIEKNVSSGNHALRG